MKNIFQIRVKDLHPDYFTKYGRCVEKFYCKIFFIHVGEIGNRDYIDWCLSCGIVESWYFSKYHLQWLPEWLGGIQFDYSTLQKRLQRKIDFEEGDLGALVDTSKWETSGHAWDDEAIDLFRSFYVLPSPAVYLDTTGRKVSYTNFDGDEEYDFLYGLNPQSTIFMIDFFHPNLFFF